MIGIRLLIISIAIGYVVVRIDGEISVSLYDSNDKVFVLNTSEHFYQSVYNHPCASIVEFYKSWCGDCRNFAPNYKKFAEDLHDWNDVIHVSAIDCADDANMDLCPDMEIYSVPTLRYFPPFHRNESNDLGTDVAHTDTTVDERHLFDLLANTSTEVRSWPNLKPIESTSKSNLFASLPNYVQYIFLVCDAKNESLAAQKVALDLRKIKQMQIRHVGSAEIASDLGLNVQSAVYVGCTKTRNIELLVHLSDLNRNIVRAVVENFLKSKGILAIVPPNREITGPDEYVKSHAAMVFQSDLEAAIRFAIFKELGKYNVMNDEQISAMKGYISVLNKFSPLHDNNQRFLDALNSYLQNEEKLNGRLFRKMVKELNAKYHPEFPSSQYIGCKGSKSGYRGRTCSLWQLFHYLTVSATNSENSTDPLEALRPIHGYVKNFLGCTSCSRHFQDMANRTGMWNVTTNDEAVLWLWAAHNEVNRRLAGNRYTEDPEFPKIQYPSQYTCPQCYKDIDPAQRVTPPGSSGGNIEPYWNTSEVLDFLRRVYSKINLSRYVVNDQSSKPQT